MRAIAEATIPKAGVVHASAGVAELAADDTSADLFGRADIGLYRAKDAGKARSATG